MTKNTKRWVVLPPEIDDMLREEAKSSQRSIANMLKYIITNYFMTIKEVPGAEYKEVPTNLDNTEWSKGVQAGAAKLEKARRSDQK